MASDKKCLTCKYSKKLSPMEIKNEKVKASHLENLYCDYICIKHKRRPCKAGAECEVYERKGRR